MMPAQFSPDVMDLGNALLGPVPSQMFANVATNPDPEIGQRAIITTRTSSASITEFLTREAVKQRIDLLQRTYDSMGPLDTKPGRVPPGLRGPGGAVDLSQLRHGRNGGPRP